MSKCYDIVCDDCEIALWVGQRNWIYTGEKETMEKLGKFLFEHEGHRLRFLYDEHHEYPTDGVN